MFSFNRKVDRYALKPVAKAWDKIVPDPVERSLKRAFDNLSMPRRLVNNLFQLKLKGAGQELARFGLNSTLGLAGLFDVAKVFGVEASEADTGQTLGRYGVRPGPYLVLPFLPPLTARDGIGFVVDTALNPINYGSPLIGPSRLWRIQTSERTSEPGSGGPPSAGSRTRRSTLKR